MPSKRELNAIHQAELAAFRETVSAEVASLSETITELELSLEDYGWTRMAWDYNREFSRQGLRTIAQLSRLFYLKNPLIQRGVDVQAHYVFGQGVSITAEDEDVNEVVQAFLESRRNQAELTSHQALLGKEVEQQVEGNIFYVLFTDKRTGKVTVRTIPASEIETIVKNPEDRKEPWYYKRLATRTGINFTTGAGESWDTEEYYPDWQYSPEDRPEMIESKEIHWDSPVFHVRTGGMPDMDFGVPEPYSALDWARAYKEFLENWSSIVKAYAMFAFNLTTKGGSAGVTAAKTKLASTIGTSSSETNPPPLVGSTFVSTDGVKLDPVKTAGATTSAEDGRRLLLMVAASMGLPESFFGDVSVGTLATARSLDRPTELKMSSRQKLWASVLSQICEYVIIQAVRYGSLQGKVIQEEDEPPRVELGAGDDGEPMSAKVSVDFPPVLEHDIDASISAVVKAATLDGKTLAGTIPDVKTLSKMLLTILDVENIDSMIEQMFPEDEPGEAEKQMVAAVAEMREALASLRSSLATA